MTDTAQTPAWIRIATATIVVQHLMVFILHPITALGVASLGVTVLLALFLLRGSRVAWVLALFSAAAMLVAPITMDQPAWFVGIAAILLACLLASPSRAFVWAERQGQERGTWRLAAQERYGRFLTLFYGLLARVPWLGGGTSGNEARDRPSRGKLIAFLVVCVLFLYPLIGAFYDFHHGAGRGSVLVDVLWEVAWRCYSLAQLALIVLLVIAAFRYVTRRFSARKTA